MTQPWLRLYRVERGAFAQLPLRARALFSELLKLTDDSGCIGLGSKAPEKAVAFALGADAGDRRFVRGQLPLLLEGGFLEHDAAARVLRFPGWSDHQPHLASSRDRTEHEPSTNGSRTRTESASNGARTGHERGSNDQRAEHEPSMTGARTEREPSMSGTRTEHEPGVSDARTEHEPCTKYELSTRNDSRARKRREEEIREEESRPPNPPSAASRWKLFEAKWRAVHGGAGLGLFDANRGRDLDRIASEYADLDFEAEVDAWLRCCAGWQPAKPWGHFRKHVGSWQIQAAAIRTNRGPAQVSEPHEFEGIPSVEEQLKRFAAADGGGELPEVSL